MRYQDPATLKALDKLEAALPQLLKEYPDSTQFRSQFAYKVHVIQDAARSGVHGYIRGRIARMLRLAGRLPDPDPK